jgi:DNA gyrase subunit B
MPELVTNGYVYIAQPPLFRIRKNKTELYLKDEKEFDQYFVDELVSASMLKDIEGKALKGEDLKEVMQKVINLNSLLESSSNGDNNFYSLLEQATISSFFNPQNFSDEKKSSQTLDYLLKRLNMIDSGWKANLIDMDFIFSKTKDKIKEDFVISLNSINQNKYYEFNKICETIQEHFLSPSKLILNDNEIEINTPRDLVSKGLELVKKGASVQRYKGLGEMNPDQLWETTLDPEFRSLLQVKIDDAQRADEIFEELMGDDVDKRKTFIQSNAKKVVNLDV